jgi:hypothetical protein
MTTFDVHHGRTPSTLKEPAVPGQAPALTDERELLLAYIDQQRDGIRNAAYGLTDEQARLTPAASSLSIGGLVRHVTAMERSWVDMIVAGDEPNPSNAATDQAAAEADYEDWFQLADGQHLSEALADLDAAARRTEAVVRATQLDRPVPVPKGVPWFPDDVEAWSVRWILLHLVEEIGRHAGHADIIRESIDGATMYELMAAAEGWPATDWLTPWTPPERPLADRGGAGRS